MFTLHTDYRGGHGLFTRVFFLSRIIEFANWFIFTRSIAESHGLIVPNLRIVELVYFHTENRGESRFYCHGFANCRIFLHTDGRGGYEGGTIEA